MHFNLINKSHNGQCMYKFGFPVSDIGRFNTSNITKYKYVTQITLICPNVTLAFLHQATDKNYI